MSTVTREIIIYTGLSVSYFFVGNCPLKEITKRQIIFYIDQDHLHIFDSFSQLIIKNGRML